MLSTHQEIIRTLANGFSDLLPKVVFTGAAALPFYVEGKLAPEVRPRDRIDVLAKVGNITEFLEWEERLRKLGFVRQEGDESPAHKNWKYQNIDLSIMPANAAITGFHNPWFEDALFQPEKRQLADGTTVKVFSAPYFLASKLEALFNRGNGDLRRSRDFEDVIYLIDNRPSLPEEVESAFYEVRQFVQRSCQKLLKRFDIEEGILYALPIGEDESRVKVIKSRLQQLAGI